MHTITVLTEPCTVHPRRRLAVATLLVFYCLFQMVNEAPHGIICVLPGTCVSSQPLFSMTGRCSLLLQVVKEYLESKLLHPTCCSLLLAVNARLNKMTQDRPNLSPPREHLFSCSTGQNPEAPWWHSATDLRSKRPHHLCTKPQLHLAEEADRRP